MHYFVNIMENQTTSESKYTMSYCGCFISPLLALPREANLITCIAVFLFDYNTHTHAPRVENQAKISKLIRARIEGCCSG